MTWYPLIRPNLRKVTLPSTTTWGTARGSWNAAKRGEFWVGHGGSRAQQHIAYIPGRGGGLLYSRNVKQDGTDAFLRSLCCSGHAES